MRTPLATAPLLFLCACSVISDFRFDQDAGEDVGAQDGGGDAGDVGGPDTTFDAPDTPRDVPLQDAPDVMDAMDALDAGPGAPDCGSVGEVCDGMDDDCDGLVDEGVTTTYYLDGDSDGFGDLDQPLEACAAPDGYVADSRDCNDSSDLIRPGVLEACNAVDDDCDGQVDDGAGLCPECETAARGASAYLFCTNLRGFADVDRRCQMWGYQMAAVSSAAENTFLRTNARRIDGSLPFHRWWLGLTDNESEGTFRWTNEETPIDFTAFWAAGEPNGGSSENCVRLLSLGVDAWSDTRCDNSAFYICEATAGP